MIPTDTLLLTRFDVSMLLGIEECIEGVEQAFKLYAEGKAKHPGVLGIHADEGGFHIKAGIMELSQSYFVAKTNSNFPANPQKNHLPTIQGVIIVCDANNGRLLAVMDSIEITIIRTGAATAVAAKYFSLEHSKVATICGCGNQGKISVATLLKVRNIEKIYACDINQQQIENLANQFAKDVEVVPITVADIPDALSKSQICITCTTSKKPFIHAKDIMPGTFIAAVGADNEDKRELHADVLRSGKIIVDLVDQCKRIGELHHVLNGSEVIPSNVHAELGAVIAGLKPGRESEEEIIVFDSTGTALQDVAAAAIVYDKAVKNKIGTSINFSADGDKRLDEAIQRKNQKDIDALLKFYPFR